MNLINLLLLFFFLSETTTVIVFPFKYIIREVRNSNDKEYSLTNFLEDYLYFGMKTTLETSKHKLTALITTKENGLILSNDTDLCVEQNINYFPKEKIIHNENFSYVN